MFTKDSLGPNKVCINNEKADDRTCIRGSSLVSNTHGNKVISELVTPVEVPFIEYTKSNDDWLNEITAE